MSLVMDSNMLRSISQMQALSRSNFSFRVCSCLKHKGYLVFHKALNSSYSSARVFNSYEPKEANLDMKDATNDRFLIDCGADQECVFGGIVALGKFDALHTGHRELAIQASKGGPPFLLSFVGMAEVLGWERRAPIVAKCDRKRVLTSWSPLCGNMVPLEYHVEFSNVRHLTPRQFVEKLSKELGVSGVVAGENYRFGYKASGDASELVRLCEEYGLSACIVNSVMDKSRHSSNGAITSRDSRDRGQVSSTRVRHALAAGDMKYVSELLGRNHRLMLTMDQGCFILHNQRLSAPKSCMLNQPPREGSSYPCTIFVDDGFAGHGHVIFDSTHIHVELDVDSKWGPLSNHHLIGIEFDGLRDGCDDESCQLGEVL